MIAPSWLRQQPLMIATCESTLLTDFSSTECRAKGEAKLALAERGGAAREQMLVDAEAWMLLADQLDYIEIALTRTRRQLQ
jgi:hypothetical protein